MNKEWASRFSVLRQTSIVRLLRGFAEGLVHPSVADDRRLVALHVKFIGSRVLMGIVAAAALPAFAVIGGGPDPLELTLFAGLIAPMGAAILASRTGRLDLARLVSAGLLVITVAVTALLSGGVFSPAIAWLVLAPAESIERATRRELMLGGYAAIAAVGVLSLCAICGWTPVESPSSFVVAPVFVLTALIFTAFKVLRSSEKAARTERALTRLRDGNRAILEHLSDLFTRHDETGACTFASSAAKSLLGVDAQELLGHGLFQRVHVADRPAFLRTITDAGSRREPANVLVRLRDDTAQRDQVVLATRRDRGEPRFIWTDLRAYPVISEDLDEDRIEVVAVMRDVSAQKAREEELERARIVAEEANRSKSRFLATVSHELRTPLNAVIGFSEMLANPDLCPKDPARLRDYARIINNSGVHLLDVVNSFLDASRIESGHFELNVETFDLAELVKSACAIVDVKIADSGVRLTTIAPADGLAFEGDKRACRQIVINLVSNAVKFTPKGGRVKVQLRRVGSLLELAVDDTGIGIAASDLARLGDPFFQAKSSYDRPYEGTGLGLSVVRGLVGLHGGSLQIESTPGAGTCVSVRLPAERPAEAPSTLSIPRIDARPRSSPAQAVA
ncbi:two-component system, cell cycle sensor histidine kinase DivJ [Rhizobiales bacterium GAS188]|nr:two-component system, cell cycle sensor histidine kinase DivJ [Rhizobiales bacterium GAS188]